MTSDAKVLILSGPNLNLLGTREPEIYGTATLEDHVAAATAEGSLRGITIEHRQSNSEGVLVDAVGEGFDLDGIIVNAGALTHYGWSLHDALAAFDGPVIELHITNPAAREDFRHHSVLSSVASVVIAGLGGAGYPLSVQAMATLLGRVRQRS